MKRRSFLEAIISLPIILSSDSCERKKIQKISTDTKKLGNYIYEDTPKNRYFLISEKNNQYVIILSKKEIEKLDSLKIAGVDSISIKPSNISFTYGEKEISSYVLSR
jgi:hypothetical protein